MGSFRENNRRGSFSAARGSDRGFGGRSGGFGGGRREGGFGGRGRSFGGPSRAPLQMYDATCSKCGKECRVPFKPTGSKPVFCSDCFRQSEGGSDRFGGRSEHGAVASGGMTQAQFKQLNDKLDKILSFMQELEIEVVDDEEDEEDEDDSEEKE